MAEHERPPEVTVTLRSFYARFEPRNEPHYAHLSTSVDMPTLCQRIPDAPIPDAAGIPVCKHCLHIFALMTADVYADDEWDE